MPRPITPHAVVVGAGIGGLAAAIELAAGGWRVTVLERQARPGGKMRQHNICGLVLDAGPTVLTLPGVFEDLFKAAGADFGTFISMRRAKVLARHVWADCSQLDLHADPADSAKAIADFSSQEEAQRFLSFCSRAERIYRTLDQPFMRSPRPGLMELVRRVGMRRLGDLWNITPFTTLWQALGREFRDQRLRQLFARYATYCGSSPFLAPATLMLIAHAEHEGVWFVDGGMQRLAEAMTRLAMDQGTLLRCSTDVATVIVGKAGRAEGVVLSSGEVITADAVVLNADTQSLAGGRFGKAAGRDTVRRPAHQRSLSALTWAMVAQPGGVPLLRHNVFFSSDYAAEFDDLHHLRVPAEPTVYVCAQDRGDPDDPQPSGKERLFCLINAPADGDKHIYDEDEVASYTKKMERTLEAAGLRLNTAGESVAVTTPSRFEQLFPGTGGALYGSPTHGWRSSFTRPGSRAGVPGLYLAGGSVHPGAGVPMAALSGRMAASCIISDHL